jgi:hypothetical protein
MADIKLTALPEATSLALTDILLVTKSPGGAAASNKVTVGVLLNTVAWTDYSATSTITGFATYTQKQIFYKRIGTLVFVTYGIGGNSDGVDVRFTLPYTIGAVNPSISIPIVALNAGSQITTAVCYLQAGGGSAAFFTTIAAGGWTNSSTRAISGQFFYEV